MGLQVHVFSGKRAKLSAGHCDRRAKREGREEREKIIVDTIESENN